MVGNGGYEHAEPLANPPNDARAVSRVFRAAGWKVVTLIDASREEIAESARALGPLLDDGEEAIFFYAGHGMQINGENYLVPVTFDPNAPVVLDRDLIPLTEALDLLKRSDNQLVVFLDACRDNPLQQQLERRRGASDRRISLSADTPAPAMLTFGQGLAEVATSTGTFIAYATQPGNVALDGTGAHSPFTDALLRHLGERNKDVTAILRNVRSDVISTTRGAQVPWDHSSLTRPIIVNPVQVPAPLP